tara:strand:- start:99 stop:506 length:408 start_codon:yes stop_codon:yes gene_type:complete
MIKYLTYIIIYFFIFCFEVNSAEILKKSYLTKDCEGHESICGDSFVFKITFEKKSDIVKIQNSNLLNHRHVEKISDQNYKTKNNNFFISFHVINNLENKFDFEIFGHITENNFEAKKITINSSNQFLAEYKLILL